MTQSKGREDEPLFEQRRLAFGGWAGDYDRFRPGYPDESLRWMVGTQPPALVVDLAAGTGRIGARLASLGYDVLAVEPDDSMRAVAERALPGRTVAGTAESIPLPDASCDAVVVGQAWHWFDADLAVKEIARVVRPGGHLGIVWNRRDDLTGWMSHLTEITGSMASLRAEGAAAAPDLGPSFGPVETLDVRHVQRLDVDGLLGLASSWSYLALRPDRDAVMDRIRQLVLTDPETATAAGRGEPFDFPYVARSYRATRLP